MKIGSACVVIAMLAACGGGDDGSADAGIDSAGAPVCSGQPYEPCVTEHDCVDGQACRQSNMLGGIFLCTPDCSMPCPPVNGTPVECNMMGTACRVTMAATCTPP